MMKFFNLIIGKQWREIFDSVKNIMRKKEYKLLIFCDDYEDLKKKMIDNIENVREYFLDKNIHDNYVLPNILEGESGIDFLNDFKY